MMKIKGNIRLLLFFLGLTIIITSCYPRIYGQRKHRIDRNCGCELITYPATEEVCDK